jgi:hypothetical protein
MGINDLLTTHPEIAAQAYGWDPSKLLLNIIRSTLEMFQRPRMGCNYYVLKDW